MTIFNQYTNTLELVEGIADLECHPYCDEDSTSELFDQYLEEIDFFSRCSHDDEPAISEAFSSWTDMLCDDGHLHSEQVNQYCYVGKWS